MDRAQILLVGLPLFLFVSDLISLFGPHPPPPHHHRHHHGPPHHHHHHHGPPHLHPHHVPPHLQKLQQQQTPETLEFPSQKESVLSGIGLGNRIDISFCSSCSYKGNAVTMKKMLENAFPGTDVVLANHPASLPKRLVSKLVPVAQVGVVGLVIAGEQVFPMLGFVAPPAWFHSLRANRFGTIASSWLLGNALQSFLQSTGAFEVFLNNELVFSKLKEGRFPGEIELRDLVSKKLASSRNADGVAALWP